MVRVGMGKTVMSVYVTIRRWNGLGWIWLGGWLRGNLTYICQLVSPVNPSWAGCGGHQSAAIKHKVLQANSVYNELYLRSVFRGSFVLSIVKLF